MSEWKYLKIGDLVNPKKHSCVGGPFGSNLISEDYIDAPGIPVIRGNNFVLGSRYFYDEGFVFVSEEKADSLFQNTAYPGDLVFTQRGTIGNIALIPNDSKFPKYILSQNLMKLSVNSEKADPRFICYYFLSPKVQQIITRNSVGSTIPGFNLTQLRDFPVSLPSLKEQTEIADILFGLDRKIENLRKQNETLEQIAQTLFKHWFVDFEFPNEDGKPYKSSGGEMERSELGEIPAGWSLLELGDVATNHSETHKFENNSKVVFINTGDVLEGNFLHHNYSPVETLPGQAKKKIRQNDILYSEIRPINRRFAYVNFSHNLDDYVVSTKFMVVRSNGKILPRLLYLILKRDSTIQEFHHIADSRSGTFPQITFESVSKFPIAIPEISLQENLRSVITPLIEKREFNVQKIKTLTKTRDVLLPQLMSGKICIGD